jgi:TDG/mug DNA glycosylase family protein
VAKHEFIGAAAALERKLHRYKPRYLAFLGKAAYVALSQKHSAEWGLQDQTMGDSAVWLLPNPSGLNRGFSQDALVTAYRLLCQALPERSSR